MLAPTVVPTTVCPTEMSPGIEQVSFDGMLTGSTRSDPPEPKVLSTMTEYVVPPSRSSVAAPRALASEQFDPHVPAEIHIGLEDENVNRPDVVGVKR